MGDPTSEVGYTSPQPEGRPRSSRENVVAFGEEKNSFTYYKIKESREK
jgi:hypothetical protein